MKLVVVAQPRSCSTWLMNQLRTSALLHVIENHHGELTTPACRDKTRQCLGLAEIEDFEHWDMDSSYADLFWQQHPNGCFKILGHGNGAEFYRHLMNRPDVHFATIQRSDLANVMASSIACAIKLRLENDPQAYEVPTRERRVLYTDIDKFSMRTWEYKRARILEHFYYMLEGKNQRWLTEFSTHERCVVNITDTNGMSELAQFTNSTPDWDSLRPVSTYREIFSDWEVYEEDIKNILGIT